MRFRFVPAAGIRIYKLLACIFFGLYIFVTLIPVAGLGVKTLSKDGWTEADGDVLIALTADVHPDGLLGLTSYWRAVYTARAWHAGHFKKVLVSGGYMNTPRSLSSAFAEFLVGTGVPPNAIILEERSTSTHENAVFTAEILRNVPGKKVLLTSDLHIYRATRAFRKAGLDVTPRTFPDVLKRSSQPLNRFNLTIDFGTEMLKILYYEARGWI